ncbi:M3 family oligoendopeptidase [Proteinivorax hydrogeniformans]|uniref:M3 family oligoendopeptidase n=1 Tax=Proteinivorax hydrogeniformans TaxID=1826727 RepID=A0AAU8HRU2_9FIRM
MEGRWNLDDLYTSFDSSEFKCDMEKLDLKVKEINNWAKEKLTDNSNPQQVLEEYIDQHAEIYSLIVKLMAFGNLSLSTDAKNQEAANAIEKLQMKMTELTFATVAFKEWLGSLENLDEILDSTEKLKEHKFYFQELELQNKYTLSKEKEEVIAKMKNTGSSAWSKLQNNLTSTLTVEIEENKDKKKYPLPVVRNMAFSKDSKVRKKAYIAELKSYEKIEESSAAALNAIKGEVITVSKMRGFKSPLEETLIQSRMDQETLDAMLQAIQESLPIFHKYYKKKGELLGHKNGVPFYDMFAPVGSVETTFSYKEAQEFILEQFDTFSSKLAEFAKHAFDNNWLDIEPREGKRGGAFCSNLHPIKQSRILSNFTGSLSDVGTLAHELGHGYHGQCLYEESMLNSSYPMPLAETASIFCETIVSNAVLKEASDKEAIGILEGSISQSGQVIADIYSRYYFESKLFEKRKESSLSVDELKEIMLEAQRKAYGDGLDHDYLHPYMWVCKPHYYSAGRSFYNFPYSFGLLFSLGIYAQYLEEGEAFVEKYDKLLSLTGKNTIADVAAMVGIDVRSVDFWRSSLNIIAKDIDKFLELVE